MWRPVWPSRLLALYWALAGLCMARPGVVLLGIGLDLVPAALVVALFCAIFATTFSTSRAARFAAWCAALSPMVVILDAVIPGVPALAPYAGLTVLAGAGMLAAPKGVR